MTLVSLLAMSPIAWQRPPEPEPESEPPRSLETLAIQVLLDRLQFSPGEIDGREGLNTLNAIDAFERERGRRVRDLLTASVAPATVRTPSRPPTCARRSCPRSRQT